MNMLWNTDPIGICLVFPSLQITSTLSLWFYLIVLVLLGMLYEYTRLAALASDRALRLSLRRQQYPPPPSSSASHLPSGSISPRGPPGNGSLRPSPINTAHDAESLLGGPGGGRRWGSVRLPFGLQAKRSLWYTLNLALSFYLMLLVMSYNSYIVAAMLVGGGVGHFVFTRQFDLEGAALEEDGKMMCH